MNWGLIGQIATAWGMVAFLAAPLIGRYLRVRRVRVELEQRLKASQSIAAKRVPVRPIIQGDTAWQTLAREAVTPITELSSEWQQNARRAESLGFMDEIEPKRAS